MISHVYVDPRCFYCGVPAYKVRIDDNRLVCRECEHNA